MIKVNRNIKNIIYNYVNGTNNYWKYRFNSTIEVMNDKFFGGCKDVDDYCGYFHITCDTCKKFSCSECHGITEENTKFYCVSCTELIKYFKPPYIRRFYLKTVI